MKQANVSGNVNLGMAIAMVNVKFRCEGDHFLLLTSRIGSQYQPRTILQSGSGGKVKFHPARRCCTPLTSLARSFAGRIPPFLPQESPSEFFRRFSLACWMVALYCGPTCPSGPKTMPAGPRGEVWVVVALGVPEGVALGVAVCVGVGPGPPRRLHTLRGLSGLHLCGRTKGKNLAFLLS